MTFYEIITAAIADIERHGYDSADRLDKWIQLILKTVKETMQPTHFVEEQLRRHLTATYAKLITDGKILKLQPGVSIFDINRIKPKLHAELQRRIMSSAQLIKINREDAINSTIQRFAGWATSVPIGGSKVTETNDVKSNIGKALKQLPFSERRVLIDQGHKFVATLNDLVATEAGAIAARWKSHYRQAGYDFRPDHKNRNDKVYAIRDNWAMQKGLMNKGDGYTDEMTAPGEEINCRCAYTYIYSLKKLPKEMLTTKGLQSED